MIEYLPQPDDVSLVNKGINSNIEPKLHQLQIRLTHHLDTNTLEFYSLLYNVRIFYKFDPLIHALNKAIVTHISDLLKQKFLLGLNNLTSFNIECKKLKRTYPTLEEKYIIRQVMNETHS